MAFSYGLTFPAAFLRYQSEEYPDLFKFYTAVPTRSTESTAANKRRPVLYTSMNGGVRWKFESASTGFYQANYCGNFYFDALNEDADHGVLMALAHKSVSSSYGAYKARGGLGTRPIKLGVQGWETSSVVAYSTANQPNREICKNLSSSANQGRYFCIRDGGGFVYNNTAWSTANWTSLSLPSNTALNDDGGFRHFCVNPERDHDALVYLTSNDTNKYLKFYLFNTNDLNYPVDYTSVLWTNSVKQANYKYLSVGYLPKVGYLIFYNYSSGTKGAEVKILRTYDPQTGEELPYNEYVAEGPYTLYGSDAEITQYGSHGWYCPWTKEYYFCPNARCVCWSKDGVTWEHSANTSSAATAVCRKFMTDGQSMVIATSGSAFYYSRDKGQTWINDYTVSPECFNTARSTDTIVIPFKCVNNIGFNTNDILIGQHINGSGNVEIEEHWFQTNYIPVDPDTSYVFYGSAKEDFDNVSAKQKTYYNQINYYDSNYNWISRKEGADYDRTANQREVPCLFTSPSNAAYAVLCSNVNGQTATQSLVNKYKWYFAKETDFQAMTNYGNIVCD